MCILIGPSSNEIVKLQKTTVKEMGQITRASERKDTSVKEEAGAAVYAIHISSYKQVRISCNIFKQSTFVSFAAYQRVLRMFILGVYSPGLKGQ